MRGVFAAVVLLGAMVAPRSAAADFKVFISVDMEGVSGVVVKQETAPGHHDYEYFRKLMARETNAAVRASLEAGATEVVVKDAHGNAMNIIPDDLIADERVTLIRNWSNTEKMMMEGIKKGCDAAIFIGYHAGEGVRHAVIEHNFTGGMTFWINEIKMNEGSYNALMAGHYGVPVVFVSGDQAAVDEIRERLGSIETVAVKAGIGEASRGVHPKIAETMIYDGVKTALARRDSFRPYVLTSPYTLKVQFRSTYLAASAGQFPGVEQIDSFTVEYSDSDLYNIFNVYHFLVNLN